MQLSLFLLILMGLWCFTTCQLYNYHFIKEEKNWSDAQNYCRDKYTDLATVSNMTDMGRLLARGKGEKGPAWIGLSNQTDGNRTWHWSLPGMEFNENETAWNPGEPNAGETVTACAAINSDLKWVDVLCVTKQRFICYKESETPEKFPLVKENKNWWEAQSYCREKHTDLISGLHQLQDKKLNGRINGNKQYLIGLFRDTWKWSDGSSFSFRHWDPQDYLTSFQQNKNQCAMIQLNEQRRWKTDDCDKENPFFCYEDNVILIKEKMSWEDALYYCRDHHHDLVTISNLDEQRWVQEKAKSATTPFVWTGVRYTCTLDFWFWVSDEAVSYKNWASGKEMDECNMSGAMETGGQHKWFKKNDAEEFHFLCSKS